MHRPRREGHQSTSRPNPARIQEQFKVELDEQRARIAPESGARAQPTDDVVLRACRLR